jgi:SAM-dependent methyltransferase
MNETNVTLTPPDPSGPQLRDTRDAFDSVAADYDGPRGNNEQIQEMRGEMWRALDRVFSIPSQLIDLGCGTGLDAIRMAKLGHLVAATDWSPLMVQRTSERAEKNQVADRVRSTEVGAHELHSLGESGQYDGAYSNLGPLNCVPNLGDVSNECARLIRTGGHLVFTVIGRICPWEIAHYLGRRRWSRATLRFARRVVPVSMNDHTIWTRYYRPLEFYKAFESNFSLEHYHGLCVFTPPPYLGWVRTRHPVWHQRLRRLDRRVSHWPIIRGMGDHFLIVMKRR